MQQFGKALARTVRDMARRYHDVAIDVNAYSVYNGFTDRLETTDLRETHELLEAILASQNDQRE